MSTPYTHKFLCGEEHYGIHGVRVENHHYNPEVWEAYWDLYKHPNFDLNKTTQGVFKNHYKLHNKVMFQASENYLTIQIGDSTVHIPNLAGVLDALKSAIECAEKKQSKISPGDRERLVNFYVESKALLALTDQEKEDNRMYFEY